MAPDPSTPCPPARPADLFGLVVEAAPDGVLTVDRRGIVQTFNAAAERMFGYARADVLGRDVRMLIPEPAAGAPRAAEGRRQDGTTLPIDVTFAELDGAAAGPQLALFVRDPAAAGTQRGPRRDGERMEAIGRLAFGIAHDFANLLTVICGYSETMLATLPQQHPCRAHADEVRRAGEQAAALTRQLLGFGRRQSSLPRRLDLNDVVLNLEAMLRRLLGEDVVVRHRLDPAALAVTADLALLEARIVTLAVEARDALPAGGLLTFATGVVVLDEPQARAEGVPPGRYARLTVSGATPGLPGEPERGTTMRLHLPVEQASAETAPVPIAPAGERTPTILVVEDDATVRRLAALHLEAAGYVVRVAGLGQDAVAEAEAAGPIHLLVTDMVLPDMTGPELADRLRAGYGALAVLFISGYPEPAVPRDEHEGAAPRFLQKPFAPSALEQAVRALLRGGEAPA